MKDIIITDEEGMPESLIEYGFHYSHSMDMVRNAAHVLKLFNQWPEQGGYFDQDAFLVNDMLMYQRLEEYKRSQYKDNKTGQ